MCEWLRLPCHKWNITLWFCFLPSLHTLTHMRTPTLVHSHTHINTHSPLSFRSLSFQIVAFSSLISYTQTCPSSLRSCFFPYRSFSSLIPSLSQKVRSLAIMCLTRMVALTLQKSVPFKSAIVNGLLGAIDDPKRTVRQLAAKCRNIWTAM